jgi:hypothetical protein
MARSGRRRGRVGMTVVSAVLSIVVSAQHARQEGGEGHDGEGRFVAEMVVTESLGAFRNVARLIFLIAAVADVER